MERKDIDWGNLGFGYVQTDMRYVSNFRNAAPLLIIKAQITPKDPA